MITILQQLGSICKTNVLGPKILLASTRRQGHQWISQLALNGSAAVNLHIETPQSLAVSIFMSSPDSAAEFKILPATLGPLLCREMLTGQNHANPDAMAEAIFSTITDLRQSMISAGQLEQCPFSTTSQGRRLIEYLVDYQKLLQKYDYLDTSDIFVRAASAVKLFPHLINTATIISADSDQSQWTADIWNFWHSLPEDNRVTLKSKHDMIAAGTSRQYSRSARASAHSKNISDNTDLQISFSRGKGPSAQVRHVLRFCMANSIPLDHVELLYTNQQAYLETAARQISLFDKLENCVTFLQGLPATLSRPGKLLQQWIKWISENYDQQRMENCIAQGLIKLPGDISAQLAASTLSTKPIGFGRGRWLAEIEIEKELNDQSPNARQLKASLAAIAALLGDLPENPLENTVNAAKFYRHAEKIVSEIALCINHTDNLARNRLTSSLDILAHWYETCASQTDLPLANVLESLGNLLNKSLINAAGPQSGKLFCAPLDSGGHSGRPYVFILGLNDEYFPGSNSQDPILPDTQRSAISDELHRQLPLSWHSGLMRQEKLFFLLTELSGNINLSYSTELPSQGSQLFPATILLSILAAKTNCPTADIKTLENVCGAEAALLCNEPFAAITETECAMCRTEELPCIDNISEIIDRNHTNLARGQAALQARQDSTEFSSFLGNITAELQDTQRPYSPSGLEMLGRCPRSFFFRYMLGIKPPDKKDISDRLWLNPLDFGTLIHDTLCDFYLQWSKNFARPQDINLDGAENLIDEILLRHVERLKKIVPISTENAYQASMLKARECLSVFLAAEKNYLGSFSYRPKYLEVGIAMQPLQVDDDGGSGIVCTGELDQENPVPLHLPEGQLYLRGRLDRIDSCKKNPDHYVIWDYKTGSAKKFDQKPPFNQGRILQHWLYTRMVEAAIGGAIIDKIGYFFLSKKEKGFRKSYSRNQLSLQADSIMACIHRIIRTGSYLATDNTSDCSFCDYKCICGDIRQVCQHSKALLSQCESELLDPLRQLRKVALKDD